MTDSTALVMIYLILSGIEDKYNRIIARYTKRGGLDGKTSSFYYGIDYGDDGK